MYDKSGKNLLILDNNYFIPDAILNVKLFAHFFKINISKKKFYCILNWYWIFVIFLGLDLKQKKKKKYFKDEKYTSWFKKGLSEVIEHEQSIKIGHVDYHSHFSTASDHLIANATKISDLRYN